MTRKKRKKVKEPKLSKGKPIDPILLKARSLRNSLLGRVPESLKETTPTIKELHKWLTLPAYICYYSLEPLEFEAINIDHKIPLQRGGTNIIDNLCICSSSYNRAKGTLTEHEFRSLLELIKTWEDKGESLIKRLKQGHFG